MLRVAAMLRWCACTKREPQWNNSDDEKTLPQTSRASIEFNLRFKLAAARRAFTSSAETWVSRTTVNLFA